MRKTKSSVKQKKKAAKKKKPRLLNHWIIQVGATDLHYFYGPELAAEGRRMYYAVGVNKLAWKRRATPDEIEQRKALDFVKKEDIVFTKSKSRKNRLETFLPEADANDIQKARDVAQVLAERHEKQRKHQLEKIKKNQEAVNKQILGKRK